MHTELMSLEEIECLSPGVGVNTTTMHANLLKRLCDTARSAHELKSEVELLRIANENFKKQLLETSIQLNESIIHARTNSERVIKLIEEKDNLQLQAKIYVDDAKCFLEDAYTCASTGPRAQQGINAACDLLDKIFKKLGN